MLEKQLRGIETSFCDVIREFDYSVNESELRIESIFVKQFNSDIYFKPSDAFSFVRSLLTQFSERLSGKQLPELSDQEFDDALEIIKALRNLIQYQGVLGPKTAAYFQGNLSLFCSLIKSRDSDLACEARTKAVSSIVFDILKIFSKSEKFAEFLLSNVEFVKLVMRLFAYGERDLLDHDDVAKAVQILQAILANTEIETEPFMVKYGTALFLLNGVFDNQQQKRVRADLTKLLRLKLEEVKGVIGAVMPLHFFTMMEF